MKIVQNLHIKDKTKQAKLQNTFNLDLQQFYKSQNPQSQDERHFTQKWKS